MAAKYRPIVYLKEQREPCDTKGEAYVPVGVEAVLGNPDVALLDDGALVKMAPLAADLFERGETFYLDLPGNPKRPACTYEDNFHALGAQPLVYAHITQENGRDELVLQYWLYFYFNDWNNNHESDWEFVQLVFDEASAEEALASSPARVIYSQHGGGETSDWTSDKLNREGNRPVVYVAKGSHALQYGARNYLGKGEQGTGFGCDDASGPSYRVDPEVRLIPEQISEADDPFAWITYTGRWGERQGGEFNGPTGPNTKKPWSQPLWWMEGQRDSSVEVPEGSIGPNAAEAFCGVVAFGSRLLFGAGIYVVLAMAGAVIAGATITVRRTRFRPVITAPLAQRRQFGQILRAAFRLERQEWQLFLGIGALFVPIGIVTALLQSWIMTRAPVEPIVETIDTATASAIVALALGALQFGITCWLVVSASIAAIGEMDDGREATVAEAYRTVWKNLLQLGLARLRALAIVIALSLTVIGIPWAILYSTRWLFVEQAVLLDGKASVEARRMSARVVQRRFLRTLGSAMVIAVTGIAVGPAIGVLLVLLTSTSLVYINVVSSLLYLALIPFVGIALTLLYFDLRMAEQGNASTDKGEEPGRGPALH